jgi:hypothetical protein
VTRGVLHIQPTPWLPGLVIAGRPLSKLLGPFAKSFNIYWVFFGPILFSVFSTALCHNSRSIPESLT